MKNIFLKKQMTTSISIIVHHMTTIRMFIIRMFIIRMFIIRMFIMHHWHMHWHMHFFMNRYVYFLMNRYMNVFRDWNMIWNWNILLFLLMFSTNYNSEKILIQKITIHFFKYSIYNSNINSSERSLTYHHASSVSCLQF